MPSPTSKIAERRRPTPWPTSTSVTSGQARESTPIHHARSRNGLPACSSIRLAAVHDALYTYFVEHPDAPNLSQSGPALDALADAITQIRVVGPVEQESAKSSRQASGSEVGLDTKLSSAPKVGVTARRSTEERLDATDRTTRSGMEQLRVNFGSVGAAFRQLTSLLTGRLWILLDEWSSVPLDLQPYLADLLRRSVMPTAGVTLKIAAIEQRSKFQLPGTGGDYIGIEVGADASADVNLDDFMVFDNDAERAKEFFRDLLFHHSAAALPDDQESRKLPSSARELVRQGFTQIPAFEEYVRASEGVPRDAINIITLAAQRALNDSISIDHVRVAARNWYQRDKDTAIRANKNAHELLQWIIDRVIGDRRARAFLLESSVQNDLIESLYDARVLHVLKRGIATHDQPGIRYDVYKLDFGCFVDLIATARAPLGLLPSDDRGKYVEVPPDDYRSIRRAILYLDKFFRERKEEATDQEAEPE